MKEDKSQMLWEYLVTRVIRASRYTSDVLAACGLTGPQYKAVATLLTGELKSVRCDIWHKLYSEGLVTENAEENA